MILTREPAKVLAALESAGVRAIVPLEEWELLGDPKEFPRARNLCQSTVSLPLYPMLSPADVRMIAETAARI